ncbi:hypothetical protein PoB_001015000 [Plakobranchus ocellatus]|uniref:Uncharacterized protein n=1 Tax=Plakobranchus ocellatus TaxID=259542 RepID=A0AAV3YKL0_9GAST|nr:hypothetical protein PoB_001015000 [Plakobranchus ocellatus]
MKALKNNAKLGKHRYPKKKDLFLSSHSRSMHPGAYLQDLNSRLTSSAAHSWRSVYSLDHPKRKAKLTYSQNLVWEGMQCNVRIRHTAGKQNINLLPGGAGRRQAGQQVWPIKHG